MDSIPIEVLCKIFIKLTIDDILNCRNVCKKFSEVVDKFLRLNSLVIARTKSQARKKSFYLNESLVDQPYIKINRFNFLDEQLKQSLFCNLKRLYIYDISLIGTSSIDKWDFLNSFQKLEKLKLAHFNVNVQIAHLELPNLRILELLDAFGGLIILDTIKLTKFCCLHSDKLKIEFTYPAQIDFCQLHSHKSFVKKFLNLKYYQCERLNWIEDDFVKHLPALEEVQMCFGEQAYKSLINQKKQFKRDNLTVYFRGIYFENDLPSVLDIFNYNGQDIETLMLFSTYYENLADQIPFIKSLNFNFVDRNFERVPSDFVSKFIECNCLVVDELETNKKQREFIQFLKKCKTISSIRFKNSYLSQQFFTNFLPKNCRLLLSISLIEDRQKEIDCLNFNFIFKFDYLTEILTNKNLNLDFLRRISKELRHFEFITCHYNQNQISIQNRTNQKELILRGNLTHFHTFNDLFQFLSIHG